VTRYRSRQREVEAIRWLGRENCEEVFAFLGLEHTDDETETDHSQLWFNSGSYAEVGFWLVRDGDGEPFAMFNEDFEQEFEAAE